MPRKAANGVRILFHEDCDFTPDHRTIAFLKGALPVTPQVLEIFAVDNLDELGQALKVHGLPADLVDGADAEA